MTLAVLTNPSQVIVYRIITKDASVDNKTSSVGVSSGSKVQKTHTVLSLKEEKKVDLKSYSGKNFTLDEHIKFTDIVATKLSGKLYFSILDNTNHLTQFTRDLHFYSRFSTALANE